MKSKIVEKLNHIINNYVLINRNIYHTFIVRLSVNFQSSYCISLVFFSALIKCHEHQQHRGEVGFIFTYRSMRVDFITTGKM